MLDCQGFGVCSWLAAPSEHLMRFSRPERLGSPDKDFGGAMGMFQVQDLPICNRRCLDRRYATFVAKVFPQECAQSAKQFPLTVLARSLHHQEHPVSQLCMRTLCHADKK